MRSAAVLTIGDELLRGDLVDTNAGWLSQQLMRLGIKVSEHRSTGDERSDIVAALGELTASQGLLIVSGGLGPTADDRTLDALAQLLGVELALDQPTLKHIERLLVKRAGLAMTPNNEKQAWIPLGALALKNDRGTAPAVSVEWKGCRVFCLPGVPSEQRWLFAQYVEPWIAEHSAARPAITGTLRCFGLGESTVDHRLAQLPAADTWREHEDRGGELSLHYRATFPEIHVTLVVRPAANDVGARAEAQRVLDGLMDEAAGALTGFVYGRDKEEYSASLVARLREAGATLATAESCTGGLVGDLITNVSGSSEVFELGMVTYANAAKERLLGISQEVLEEHGAVSRQCVEAMARGVRELAGATYGVAVSGIAGPSGGSPQKPVGTVHFALADERGVWHLERVFPYERRRNKVVAAYVALWMVQRRLMDDATDELDPLAGRWQRAGKTPKRGE